MSFPIGISFFLLLSKRFSSRKSRDIESVNLRMATFPLQNLFQAKMYPEDESANGANKNILSSKRDKFGMGYCTEKLQTGIKSGCCTDKGACLTTAARPLLIAFQIIGIFPITYHRKNCQLTHCWFSIPSLHNLAVLVGNLGGSIVVFVFSTKILAKFQGTDLYTVSLTIIAQFGASVLVFVTGNFAAPDFCKGWQMLHQVAGELKVLKYSVIRRYLIFIPLALIGDGIFNTVIIRAQAENQMVKLLVSPIVALVASFIGNFVPNFITFTFAVIIWMCGHLFDTLNQSIQSCLEQPSREFLSVEIGIYPQDHAYKLGKLRQTHENLCDAVRFLVRAFGFQLLAILPATGLRFIAGIYAVITHMVGQNTEMLRSFAIFQGMASIVAGFRIMLVILSCDAVVTKASDALKTLKRARCPRNSDELNQEIDVFLGKIGSFPLNIKCCGIITLNLSFLSTAIPNVITYVLVLMQFKQGDDNSACVVGANPTNHSSVLSN